MGMETLYSPRRRTDRLIAAGRVLLAASSLLAVWLDPSEPVNQAPVAYGLLVAYLGYAAAVAVAAWRSELPGRRWQAATHGFDLAFFSAFVYFTAGPASPFTAYFVFSLVCAALRWRWQGTLWTAAVALGAFLGIGVYFGEVRHDPAFELNELIIRGVYLAVVAVLLGYLGSHEQRTLRVVSELASWPRRVPEQREDLVREVLGYAGAVLAAPRVALLWSGGGEEDELLLATWRRGEVEVTRRDGRCEDWVHPELAGADFFCADAAARPARVHRQREGAAETWVGQPLPAEPGGWLATGPLLSVALRGEIGEGRLFFLERPGLTSDELLLATIVAGVVGARLDHFTLARRLANAAAAEERIRLARDLHDGVLQALTGISLRLEVVRRRAERAGDGAATELAQVQRLILEEQRDLRFFIQELRPPAGPAAEGRGLPAALDELVERVAGEWGLRVDLRTEGDAPEALGREVVHLVREALVNAVRHGGARGARVHLVAAGDRLRLEIADDGCGFPFVGRFTGEEMARRGEGPRSLRERVAALDGHLELESSPEGACVYIDLPSGATA